uniref:GRF1-interacting factor 1 n=1 Tax=Rhizophora mucronata TaxID=61149 RepID=A0A2P2PV43_RHIMU
MQLLLQCCIWLLRVQHGGACSQKRLWYHLLSLLVLHVECSRLHNASGSILAMHGRWLGLRISNCS